MGIKQLLSNDDFYRKMDTKHLVNLANHLKINIKDIVRNTKYKKNVRKRILTQLED